MPVEEKFLALRERLKGLGSVAVAFSGGVDSTFLLKCAHDTPGLKVLAVTARSCSFPERELNEAVAFCEAEGVEQVVVESEELDIEGFCDNPRNRCYLCKRELFEKIGKLAMERGVAWVVEGSNADDEGDYRPGMQAVRELGVISPLREAGLTKSDIRELSRSLGLPTWDKQSFACLSSRFVYGERITREKLHMVDLAEQLLLDLGFRQVRVRIHGMAARIEVAPDEVGRLLRVRLRKKVAEEFHRIGFAFVAIDLDGYRTGSMNQTL